MAEQVSRVFIFRPGVRGCRVERQTARAVNPRSLVARTLQACRPWPFWELWPAVSPPFGYAVPSAGFLADSMAFPQGSLWRERPPPLRGGAPSTSTPLVRRAGREGTCEAQPRFALSQRTRKMLVIPRPMPRFGKMPNHNGEGSALSERSVVVVKSMRHLRAPPGLFQWRIDTTPPP